MKLLCQIDSDYTEICYGKADAFPFLWFCPHDSKLWIPVFYIKSYLLRGQSPKKSLKSNRPTIFHLDIVCNKINLLKWRNSNSIITNWLEVKFDYKFQSGITVGDSTKPYICHYKPHLGLTHINTHLHACMHVRTENGILIYCHFKEMIRSSLHTP